MDSEKSDRRASRGKRKATGCWLAMRASSTFFSSLSFFLLFLLALVYGTIFGDKMVTTKGFNFFSFPPFFRDFSCFFFCITFCKISFTSFLKYMRREVYTYGWRG